jgi:GntR family transcriptional repressor for pyruvate dehydrogenase complex
MTKAPTFLIPPAVTRTSQVADWFAREIRSGRLRAGERLPTEQEQIVRFSVSRTVIREAMASLRSEGLVVSRQGAGVFVADQKPNPTFRIDSKEMRSLTEIENVLQLRLAVEVEAAGIAAERRSDDDLLQLRDCLDAIDRVIAEGGAALEADFAFHRAISSATGNPYFERFMHFLGPVVIPNRPPTQDAEQRRAYLDLVQAEHRQIYQAIADRDAESARSHLRYHLESSRDRYRQMSKAGILTSRF